MNRKLEPKNSVMAQKRRLPFLLLIFALLLVPAAPSAAESPGWAVSFGLFDIGQSEKATEAGIELHLASRRVWRFDLVPTFAITANEDGAFWGTAGFRLDVPLGEKWVLTPNFGTLLYEQGDSKDLGHVIEFRSGIEIARRLGDGRLGVCLYHLSNASISSHNPGSESLVLVWSSGR